MDDADHLAGALSLALGKRVTWTPMDTYAAVEFSCNGRHSYVSTEDLVDLDQVSAPQRAALFERVMKELEGAR